MTLKTRPTLALVIPLLLPEPLLAAAAKTAASPHAHAAPSDTPTLVRIAWPLAIIAVLAGALLAVLSIVRRRMRQSDQSMQTLGFTLQDFRQLHREGKMTTEEFERAKAKLLSREQASMQKAAPPPSEEPLNVEPKE